MTDKIVKPFGPKHAHIGSEINGVNNKLLHATEGDLGAMMHWQDKLSSTVGITKATRDIIKDTIACLTGEAAEAHAHFLNGTKPWKDDTINWDEVDEEMIDCMHFLLSYFNFRNFTAEQVVFAYFAKNSTNHKRVTDKLYQMRKRNENAGESAE